MRRPFFRSPTPYNDRRRPGGRGRLRASEESPDTTGQDAGEIPGGESRRKVEQRGDRRRSGVGKGETVG